MLAAVLQAHGEPPVPEDFADPVTDEADRVIIDVAAAALHHVDLYKASGTFYTGPPPLPSVVGSDGVGRLPDGSRVYFDACIAPYGSMGERTLAALGSLLPVPEGVEDSLAAALGNSGLAAWLALEWRAKLKPGERVLVLGATGAVGTLAVQAARLLGAGRVVAAARDEARLAELVGRGADATVTIGAQSDLATALREATAGGPDVVIDNLWGEPGLAALQAAAHGARIVQVGQLAGRTLAMPAPLVRSSALDVLGFGIVHAPIDVRRETYQRMGAHAAAGRLVIATETVPLDAISAAWERQAAGAAGAKLIVVPR